MLFNKRCQTSTENGTGPIHPVAAGFGVVESLNNFRPKRASGVPGSTRNEGSCEHVATNDLDEGMRLRGAEERLGLTYGSNESGEVLGQSRLF